MAMAGVDYGPYMLRAYVRHGQVLRFEEKLGRMTFTRIYQNRPNEARYAIAGHYSVVTHADEFLVWDLFEVKKDPDNQIVEPRLRLRHDDLDAAIMAAVLLYEGGEQ
jgi:hypothetical protein